MKKIIQICLVLFALIPGLAYAQSQVKQQYVTIESIIKDEQGTPVSGAKIYGKEGAQMVKSDAEGRFTISVPTGTNLLIESEGFESRVVGLYETNTPISLKATPFLMGESDKVRVAFKTSNRRELGFVSVIEPDKISAYDNTQYVPDALTGRVAGLFGSRNIRGLGNAMVVLDGIPRYANITDINLNMEEIDQITVLKDINAVALYGSQARNGVILITTKRGKAHKRDVNILVYHGIAKPKMLPNFLGSADYMELYNEASVNDGLLPKFDAATIENYRSGNPYRYPNVDYYSSDYLKPFKNYSKVLAEFSGGNDITTFYSNLGWGRDGGLLNFGEGLKANSNRFNARANVDIKINSFIKSNVDVAGIFEYNKGPRANYFDEASSRHPYIFAPLLPIDLFERNNEALKTMVDYRKNDVDGEFMLGGNAQQMTSVIGDVYAGGYNQPVRRTMQFNNGLDIDLGTIIKGLSLKNNFSFDFYNSYNQTVSNSYSVYEPIWSAITDSIIGLNQYGADSRTGTQNVNTPSFLRRSGVFTQLEYDRTFAEHHVSATMLGFVNNVKLKGTLQPDKNAHLGVRTAYDYKSTYFIDFSGAYVNSTQLAPGNRAGMAPTLGLGWVISNEKFLSNSKIVNYLKLKASAGIINTDLNLGRFFLYDNVYSNSGNFTWADGAWGNGATISLQGANPALSFEKRKEINFGIEGYFFQNALGVEANVFNCRITDQFIRRTNLYPSEYFDFIPFTNYGIDDYQGLELALTHSKSIGSFSYELGVNAMFWDSKVIERNEMYSEDYLFRKGRPVDAIFGLESAGFFQDAEDIKNSPFQTFGEVKPGDIKYVDQNTDGIIDVNDEVQIGRGTDPVSLGLTLKLSYSGFSLFALGTGSYGSNSILGGDYYWVDGNKKYSTQVINRWTEATKATATYPRLTTKTSSNNYRSSTFWLYDDNYFALNRVQLTYDLPEKICDKLAIKKLGIYLSGSNLATFSEQKHIRDLSVVGEPQYRYFTIGLRTMF